MALTTKCFARFGRWSAFSFVLILSFAANNSGGPVWAQGADPRENSAPVCMSRKLAEGGDGPSIVVPARDVGGLVAKKFKVSGCKKLFASVDAQKAWRNEICAIARMNYPGMADSYEATVGERPAVLCGMARAALGFD